jgi:high-affinity Fe2+/Pb2+ permease
MTNLDYFIVIAAAFAGSLGSGVFGWIKSEEKFDKRKFMASVWSAAIAAMLFALAYTKTSDLGVVNFVGAFLGGAGIDVMANRSQKKTTG